MKRILHISKFYYPYYGGIENVAHALVEQLKPYYEQKVICFNNSKETVLEQGDVDVLRVGIVGVVASQPIPLNYAWHLRKMITDFRPDYLHLHLPNPLVASQLLSIDLHGAKVIVHWHADVLGKMTLYPIYKPWEHMLLKKAYKILATSSMYVEDSVPLKPFASKVVILPNTINETKFVLQSDDVQRIQEIRKRYDNRKIVFAVGRHVPYKGFDYLIDSVPYIDKSAVVLIGGSGEQTDMLKRKATKFQNVFFLGYLSEGELRYYMHAATVFAFPSLDRREAFGVALAEALYCGAPAVSFKVRGSGALWVNQDRKTGFVVENRNIRQFADAVNKLLHSDDLHEKMSISAKEWIKNNFLTDQIYPILKEIYQ